MESEAILKGRADSGTAVWSYTQPHCDCRLEIKWYDSLASLIVIFFALAKISKWIGSKIELRLK